MLAHMPACAMCSPAPLQMFPTLTISASEFHTNDGRCANAWCSGCVFIAESLDLRNYAAHMLQNLTNYCYSSTETLTCTFPTFSYCMLS